MFATGGQFPSPPRDLKSRDIITSRQINPLEVKLRTQGSMQSLRLFMKEKNIKRGIRTSLENFGQYEDIDVYPLYAIGNVVRGEIQIKYLFLRFSSLLLQFTLMFFIIHC